MNRTFDDYTIKDNDIYACTCVRDCEFIEPHPCPYSDEIDGKETLCRCCPSCTQNCANDI